MSMMHPADRTACDRLCQARPCWDRLDTAADAYGLDRNVLLHAGPPFPSVDTITMPILNSACVAAVFEGIAEDFDQAETMIRAGDIQLEPAQDHHTVTPLAAVVSASMPLHRVIDAADPGNIIYAPLNGGMRPAMRLGLRSRQVLDHIRWLNNEYAELLASALATPVDILPIAARALQAGDDCHGRTPAGTRILMEQVEAGLPVPVSDTNIREFIDTSPPLFLNLWMAASKCLMMSAGGVDNSSFVTAAAGNGRDVGIQISALPGQWFQVPATPPKGRFDIDVPADRALPAIGDSAVVEALGLGAMALQHSPEQEKNFRDFLPTDYDRRVKELLCSVHPAFSDLDCPLGLTARAAVSYGHGPLVGLGILDIKGDNGRLGGGIYDMPVSVFKAALAAIES